MTILQKSAWVYAYQGLRSELIQIVRYMGRVLQPVPEGLNLSDKFNFETAPTELSRCIVEAYHVRGELAQLQDSNAKLALAFVDRFLSDAAHFNEDLMAQSGDISHHFDDMG